MNRAIDCLVNVDLGDRKQPEWMVRVKEDYFKGGESFLASPWWDVAIRLMLKYRNLRLMTSAWSPKRLPESLLHYMRTRGKDRSSSPPTIPRCRWRAPRGRPRGSTCPTTSGSRWLLLRQRPKRPLPRPHGGIAQRHYRESVRGGARWTLRPIDADNHYYEPLDAFTRHLDPKFTRPGVQAGAGRQAHVQLLIGGKVNRFVPNPTFDPIIVPGLPRPAVPRPDPRGRRPARR